ncbi:MAG: PilZ domain-containing protein [Candidatus Omnitrophica bacterium]|nr:PilZ domain-containing protein [Candidatus Omnitrophota bacterium]MDD5574887.1 PilZ domain-containing protein [Candidatus Omnitrophota bacterium]
MPKAKRNDLEIVPHDASESDDKRTFCRFFVEDVSVRFKDLRVGAKGEGVCKDIGGGGAGFDCVREIRPKTPLEMWFDFPDGFEPMHLLGRVVWSKAQGPLWRTGIAFDRQRLMSMARILKATEV